MSEWQLVEERYEDAEGVRRGRARCPLDTPWFDGHFPDLPVLPAVAILYSTLAVADPEARARAVRLRRVRFRRAVAPGTELHIEVREPQPTSQPFQVTAGIDLVCSGLLQTIED